jgi:signal transduction histidine kinase
MYSITRRLLAIVLLSQLLLTGILTGVTLLYEREQHFRPFDATLEGRADSVVGAVQDADDEGDHIYLDTAALQLPGTDLYEVRDADGRVLGRSPNWTGLRDLAQLRQDGIRKYKERRTHYLAIVRHGTRVIDRTPKNAGVPRKFIVFYAAPTAPVWSELRRIAKFLALANSLILLVTGLLAALLLRRGMAPLKDLAEEAGKVSAKSWSFQPAPRVRKIRELATLVNALETALQGIERSFKQQQNFLSDAAHELKTAVAILKSSLQVLSLRERSPGDYQAGLEELTVDCQRMEELVLKMLLMARVEHAGSPTTESADLASCVRAVAARLQAAASLRGISLDIEAAHSVPVAIAEDECLTLIQNLALNAIQHSHEGARVRIGVSESDDKQIVLTVRDSGTGIPKEHLPYVFDRFYRGDRSRSRETGGTGLGLAICRAIVEMGDGEISIESVEGCGTTVTVSLPVAHEAPSISQPVGFR